MNQTWENDKKTNVGLILARLAQICALKIFSIDLALLGVKCSFKLLYYKIYRKINEPHLRIWWKT